MLLWQESGRAGRQHRTTFASALQALARAEFAPDVRDRIADAHRRARRELPATLLPHDSANPDDRTARALGSPALALVNGLVLEQLVDGPEPPSAADLAALRVLAGPGES